MEILSAQFTRGVIGSTDFLRDERPQVAFVGRSNVGKSSVINSLVQRKGLVKTSSRPGKTLQINFFLINDTFYFTDLPGYGYAQHGERQRDKIRKMILWYLTSDETRPCGVVLIVDAKAGLRPFDREMLGILASEGYRTILVANKMDKLNQSERAALAKALAADEAIIAAGAQVVFHSAATGRGRKELLGAIEDALGAAGSSQKTT